jgi:signal transduction histidine kinase
VGDNGVGGADVSRGSGLSGLADRVGALGGWMRVLSPRNGPTSVIVELPCGS